MKEKKTILFICTHNSARSQMAEGLVNHYYEETWQAYSAGTEQTAVKVLAIQAMQQIGVDISHHHSKTLDQFLDQQLDYVVTVCDTAKESCPFFAGAGTQLHAGFEDPSDVKGSEKIKLAAFAATRDEIKKWLDRHLPEME